MRRQAIQVVSSGNALGAEIHRVDVAAGVDDDALSEIVAAWRQHLVVVFRRQRIDDDQLIAFSERLGELDPPGPNPYGGSIYPAYPQLNIISNIIEGERPIGNLGAGEAVWHADMTYNEVPPKGAVLYALEIPAGGGDTQFANMHSAYEDLSREMQCYLEGKRAIHDASTNSAGLRRKGYGAVTDVRETPGARQPLVRTDPLTGRKSLFLGRRPGSYVVDLEVEQSEQLLDTLWTHATQDRYVFTHQWQVGDLMIWDNLSILHRRDEFDPRSRRRLHRAQLKGDGPIQG